MDSIVFLCAKGKKKKTCHFFFVWKKKNKTKTHQKKYGESFEGDDFEREFSWNSNILSVLLFKQKQKFNFWQIFQLNIKETGWMPKEEQGGKNERLIKTN